MKKHLKSILFYLLLIGVIITVVSFMFQSTEAEKLVLSDVVDYFERDDVVEFVIDEEYYLTMTVIKRDAAGAPLMKADGTGYETEMQGYQLQSLALFQEYCSDFVANNQNLTHYEIQPITPTPWWVSFIPYVVILLIFVVLWFFMMGSAGHGGS